MNNLFASAQQHEDFQTASGIAKLARMMRYILEESEATRVSMTAEADYLKHYIDLQKMRSSEEDEIDIQLEEDGYLDQQMIAPLLLIPFVENAFKHGVSLCSKSYIHIKINVTNQAFHFQVRNSNHSSTKLHENHSIGLSNVRERLELLYQERHSLKIDAQKDEFSIQLRIKLNQ